jgi:hypothetical protein
MRYSSIPVIIPGCEVRAALAVRAGLASGTGRSTFRGRHGMMLKVVSAGTRSEPIAR